VNAGHEVLMEVDDNIWLIVGDQQGILYEQLTPRPIHLLNIIIIKINYYIIQYSVI
jgi:hypothetical protein